MDAANVGACTAIGVNTLTACTGDNNTALGKSAGVSVTSGTNNLLLGRDAGFTAEIKIGTIFV